MSRLLFRLSYTASAGACPPAPDRAPIRNRTVDLLLTMETLYRLSYWGNIYATCTISDNTTGNTTDNTTTTQRRLQYTDCATDRTAVIHYGTRVSTASSRVPRARMVLAASQASNRSGPSGREMR